MFRKKPTPVTAPIRPRRIASQLEPDIELVGDLSFSGLLQVKGNIYGNVIAATGTDATLLIEAGASITGEVRASYIRIRGKVTGDVFATSRVSISASSTIIGDIHYDEIELDEGAHISGRLFSLNEGVTLTG